MGMASGASGRSRSQAMILAVVLLLLLGCGSTWQAHGSHRMHVSPVNSTLQYMQIEGTEVLWQRPPHPKAALFLAHGCSHSATDWWEKSEYCPDCIGLPEEMAIVKAALGRGYLPIAVSSQDRHFSRCWTEDDERPVKHVIREVLSREGLQRLPLFALGASSGGSFLPVLAQGLNFTGLCIQIMATHPDLLSASFPPTVFVHMQRDWYTARRIHSNVKKLKQQEMPVREYQQSPLPLSARFFSDRIPSLAPALSQRIFAALTKADYLTETGELHTDPRRSEWRQVLQGAIPELKDVNLEADESSISEVMNVAWASHEITSEFIAQTLRFFDLILHR